MSIDAWLWMSTTVCPNHEVQCIELESTLYRRYSFIYREQYGNRVFGKWILMFDLHSQWHLLWGYA